MRGEISVNVSCAFSLSLYLSPPLSGSQLVLTHGLQSSARLIYSSVIATDSLSAPQSRDGTPMVSNTSGEDVVIIVAENKHNTIAPLGNKKPPWLQSNDSKKHAPDSLSHNLEVSSYCQTPCVLSIRWCSVLLLCVSSGRWRACRTSEWSPALTSSHQQPLTITSFSPCYYVGALEKKHGQQMQHSEKRLIEVINNLRLTAATLLQISSTTGLQSKSQRLNKTVTSFLLMTGAALCGFLLTG